MRREEGSRGVARCFIRGSEGRAKLLPEWMLEDACREMRVVDGGYVALSALDDLLRLLREVGVDAGANPAEGEGHGADEVEEEGSPARADRAEAAASTLGDAAGGVSTRGRRIAGKAATKRGQRERGGDR